MAQRLGRLAFLAALILAAPAAGQQADPEGLGRTAEDAGQFAQALSHYTAALQATSPRSEAEFRLLERAASISSKVRPLPALPAEAERRFVRGQAAVQSARDAESFQRAAEEFHAAVRAAPWLADAYYNLGVVLDKAQRYNGAIRALKLYMLAAPNTKDASEAQRLIYQIEFRQEEAARSSAKLAAEATTKADQQRRLGFLAGRWNGAMTTYFNLISPGMQARQDSVTMEIAVDGTDVTMTRVFTGSSQRDLVLIGKITGSDAASVRWELPPGNAYAGERVPVQIDPTNIIFGLPVRNSNGARLNNVMRFELRR